MFQTFFNLLLAQVHIHYVDEKSSVDVVYIIYFEKFMQESCNLHFKVLEIWNLIFNYLCKHEKESFFL